MSPRPFGPQACVRTAMQAFLLLPLAATAAPAATEAPTAPAAARARVYFNNTPWFAIAGEDLAANSQCAALASRVGRALELHGFRSDDLSPGRVSVYLSPGDGVPSLNTAGGQTSVLLPAGALADAHACSAALARGALHRLAQAAGRDPAPAGWACEALAVEAALSGAPALADHLLILSRRDGVPELDAIVRDLPPDAPPAQRASRARAAFRLLRAIRRDNPGDPRGALAEAALGTPTETLLARCVPDRRAGGERAEAWWPAAYLRDTGERLTAIATLDESEAQLRRLTRFVVAANGRDLPLEEAALIARRADASVADAARRRVMDIKAELPRANPVWHNALRAHGIFLEKLPEADEAELRRLLDDARAETEIARETSAEIAGALASPAK